MNEFEKVWELYEEAIKSIPNELLKFTVAKTKNINPAYSDMKTSEFIGFYLGYKQREKKVGTNNEALRRKAKVPFVPLRDMEDDIKDWDNLPEWKKEFYEMCYEDYIPTKGWC